MTLQAFCKGLEHVTIGDLKDVLCRISDYLAAIELSRDLLSKVPKHE
jgi:hypothetical protein